MDSHERLKGLERTLSRKGGFTFPFLLQGLLPENKDLSLTLNSEIRNFHFNLVNHGI